MKKEYKKEYKNVAIEVIKLQKMEIITASFCPDDSDCKENYWICNLDLTRCTIDDDM